MSLQNNMFYELSKQFKLDEEKKKRKAVEARIPKPPTCTMCDMDPPYFTTGWTKGWCKFCADFDMWIADWADACWSESLKPEGKQNELVFLGHEKAVQDCLKEDC